MQKIILITNKYYTVKHFRRYFVDYLFSLKYDLSLVIIDDHLEDLQIDGVDIYYIKGSNRSINPFKKVSIKNEIKKILIKVKPDTVFTYQLTPNIFGVMACKECQIKRVYPMLEGLGDIVINSSFKWRIIKYISLKLLKNTLSYATKVFFINSDDRDYLSNKNIVQKNKCVVIPGIGVDVDYFAYKPIINKNVFLMASRLSKTKGVIEYCKAARIVKNKYSNVVFRLIGEEFTLKIKDIKEYIDDGSIEYLGYFKDIREAFWNCSVNVLPSYREGFGLTIAEAGACGRPSIASNVVGCKDAISHGETGLLFECNNINDLVNKIEFFIEKSGEINKMGDQARHLAETKFNKDIINKYILDEVNSIE